MVQFHYDIVSSRRVQEMLLALNDEKCELAQAIAFSTKIPELGKCLDTLSAYVQHKHSFRGTYLCTRRIPTSARHLNICTRKLFIFIEVVLKDQCCKDSCPR